jgi:hypothetical protein
MVVINNIMKTFDTYLSQDYTSQLNQLREQKLIILQRIDEITLGGVAKAVGNVALGAVKGGLDGGVKGALSGAISAGQNNKQQPPQDDSPSASPEKNKKTLTKLNLQKQLIDKKIQLLKLATSGKDTTTLENDIQNLNKKIQGLK